MIKTSLRPALVLCAICTVCTTLVAGAHVYTKDTIAARAQEQILSGYKQVLPTAANLSKEPLTPTPVIKEIQRSTVQGQTNGYIYTITPQGYGGEIMVMVGIEAPSMRLAGVKILRQQETPGLGAKCTEPQFLQQFKAKNLRNPLILTKQPVEDDDEIQAITASTITSRALVTGLNEVRAHYKATYLQP